MKVEKQNTWKVTDKISFSTNMLYILVSKYLYVENLHSFLYVGVVVLYVK